MYDKEAKAVCSECGKSVPATEYNNWSGLCKNCQARQEKIYKDYLKKTGKDRL